jgi:hypothetical protein
LNAYAAPDKNFDELRERLEGDDEDDLLREFSAACRRELSALRG